MSPKKKDSLGFTLGQGGQGNGPSDIETGANYRLGDYLDDNLPKGFVANAEQRVRNRRVDIIVEKPGEYKIYMEAKFTTLAKAKEHAQQHFVLLPSAMRPDYVGAICYSEAFHRRRAAESGEPLEFAMLDKDSGEWSPARELTAAELVDILAEPVKLRDSENEIGNAIWAVKNALKEFTVKMNGREAQFAEVLKIELPAQVKHDPKKHRAYVAARDEAMHIAGLVVVNAMMFSSALNSQTLATKSGKIIAPYDGCAPEKLKRHWERVEGGINYVSILAPARRLVDAGACDERTLSILKQAADRIRPLAERGVDILGRIFHTVLAHAKTYAAFFTGIPGATLMSEIALNPDHWENVDWRDPKSIGKLRVCDPACGSGTLIGLAAWKLRRNFRFRVDENRADKLRELHRGLVEDVIYAADIIPVASHLTATSVALISPEVSFDHANVFCAPMGVFGETPKNPKDPDMRIKALGSLAHLAGESWLSEKDRLDNLGIKVEGEAAKPFPMLDACLMNPPFVAGQKGRELFKFAGAHREELMDAFRRMAKEKKFRPGSGQGPAFLTLAADKIKPNGRLALILPSSLATASDAAWRDCRKVIEGRFDIEALIVSKDPERPAFSDSCNFSELMLIARKSGENGDEDPARWDHEAPFVVLHENRCAPDADGGSSHKALEVASAINDAIESGARRGTIPGGSFARMKWRGKPIWLGLNFANTSLMADVAEFGESGIFAGKRLPVTPLGKIARPGSRRIDKYVEERRLSVALPKEKTRFPGFWASKHSIPNMENSALLEGPHVHLKPVAGNLGWMRGFFNRNAGRIVINQSFRFDSSRRIVSMVDRPVLASHAYPVVFCNGVSRKEERAMTLWLNSSLVLAYMAFASNPTEGAKVSFTSRAFNGVPALDFKRLDKKVVAKLADSFDRFVRGKNKPKLWQFPAMAHDPARARLDDAVADALEIDKDALADLRARLAREPIISNRPYSDEPSRAKMIPAPKAARTKPARKKKAAK